MTQKIVGKLTEDNLDAVWHYYTKPHDGLDNRKHDARRIVTLVQENMTWVGIRAWHQTEQRWYNGNEPERATVKAWSYLPHPAKGDWQRGILKLDADRSPEDLRKI